MEITYIAKQMVLNDKNDKVIKLGIIVVQTLEVLKSSDMRRRNVIYFV